MSKEFQIRDGNLIASFDLENEDGDIDYCKLFKVSHGVAEEIGMFVDHVATNKIIKAQSNQIADLEAKLAESEKKKEDFKTMYFNKCLEYEHLHEKLDDKCTEFELKEYDYKQTIFEKDQDKISFCIKQLEKVKEEIGNNISPIIFQDSYWLGKQTVLDKIDNQIENLKKEMK